MGREGVQVPPQLVTMQRAQGEGDALERLLAALLFFFFSPVTLGSLELPREKQGIIALRFASTPRTWCFILASTSSSGTAALCRGYGH